MEPWLRRVKTAATNTKFAEQDMGKSQRGYQQPTTRQVRRRKLSNGDLLDIELGARTH